MAFLLCFDSASYGQSSASPASRLTFQGPAEQSSLPPAFRDPLGRSCFDVEAVARAHVANPSLMDHVVSIKNKCGRLIAVKVCYLNSDRCNELRIPSYGRLDTILGTMSGVKTFRYSLKQ